MTLDSISSDAGYKSSFGHYFADSDGNPISGTVDFANVKTSLGEGDAVSINLGPQDVPEGATQLGFFLIPNGASKNPGLTDGADVTFSQNSSGSWSPVLNGKPLIGTGSNAFFSDTSLNSDGVDHMQEVTGDNNTQIKIEDLKGGGDLDYNDVNINVTIHATSFDHHGDDDDGKANKSDSQHKDDQSKGDKSDSQHKDDQGKGDKSDSQHKDDQGKGDQQNNNDHKVDTEHDHSGSSDSSSQDVPSSSTNDWTKVVSGSQDTKPSSDSQNWMKEVDDDNDNDNSNNTNDDPKSHHGGSDHGSSHHSGVSHDDNNNNHGGGGGMGHGGHFG
jgi:hypothetical protein